MAPSRLRAAGRNLFEAAVAYGRARARQALSSLHGESSSSADTDRSWIDPHFALDTKAIGALGACFLVCGSSTYIRRNVETIEVKSATWARRRLTADVQLPRERELGEEGPDGQCIFWVPVTSLSKYPPRSNIDLRGEGGEVVPLLTKEENAAISSAALLSGAEQLLGHPPEGVLRDVLLTVAYPHGLGGDISYLLAKDELEKAEVDLESRHGRAFVEALRVLAGNSLIWVPILGEPSERRVIKLHYDIELERPKLRREKPGNLQYLVYANQSKTVVQLDLQVRGDGNPYSPVRRLASRIALALGIGTIDLGIETPYFSASDSYHLQAESPPGVEIRDVSVLSLFQEGAKVEPFVESHGIHVYATDAKLADGNVSLVNVPLRAGRRGFMNTAWISAMVTVVLLWVVAIAGRIASPEATAAVLLFGPALLAALAVRPGEHPIATKLLSGITALVAFNGLLAVAAAAAVAGIKPHDMGRDTLWTLYAVMSSLIACLVTLAWVFSWDTSARLTKEARALILRDHYFQIACLCFLALSAVTLTVASGLGGIHLPISDWIYCGALLALSAPAMFLALSYARLALPTAALAAWFYASTLACCAPLASALLAAHILYGWEWRIPSRILAGAAIIATVGLLVQQALELRRGAAD